MPGKLADASVFARRMAMSLDDLAGIASHFMDI